MALRLAALAVILVGAYVRLRTIDYSKCLSNAWVLRLDRYGVRWANSTLWDRFDAGQLSDAEAGQWLSRNVKVSALRIVSPHPANVPITVRLSVDSRLRSYSSGVLRIDDWNVCVDGVHLPCSIDEVPENVLAPTEYGVAHYLVLIPGQSPGSHAISVAARIRNSHKRPGSAGTESSTAFRSVRTVSIESRVGPITNFVKPIYDDELARSVQNAVLAWVVGTSERGAIHLVIMSGGTSVPLVGTVHLRAASEPKATEALLPLVFPPNEPSVYSLFADQLPQYGTHEDIEIRFVGSADVALDNAFDSYFAGELEWHGVPVTPPRVQSPGSKPDVATEMPQINR